MARKVLTPANSPFDVATQFANMLSESATIPVEPLFLEVQTGLVQINLPSIATLPQTQNLQIHIINADAAGNASVVPAAADTICNNGTGTAFTLSAGRGKNALFQPVALTNAGIGIWSGNCCCTGE